MPINPITLQRRHAELGRIRLGNQVPTNNGGTRPNKLSKFRFTSSSQEYVTALAALYGGTPQPWKNGSKEEWEVYSDARSIDVIVLKAGLSQWMEFWSGGGCIHRCDGVTNVLTDEPCDLNEKVKQRIRGKDVYVNPHTEAKPTTRLTVMLRDLEAIGGWRLETHGWNAAAEIPAIAELAQFVGEMVPAVLHLMERTSVKDGKTSQFVVPVLDLKIGSARLNEIVAAKMGQPLAIASSNTSAKGAPAALSAPTVPAGVPNYLEQAQQCSTIQAVQAIWAKASEAGHLTEQLAAELKLVGDALVPKPAEARPDEDGAYDAVVVDEGAAAEADLVWNQVLAEGGRHGMNLTAVADGYSEFSGGLLASAATAAELQGYLVHLQGLVSERVPA